MAISLELIDALKRCLRAHDMTCRDLAARLKLSEAAIKRMFSQRAKSLLRLEQVCEALDLGPAGLTAEGARGRPAMANPTGGFHAIGFTRRGPARSAQASEGRCRSRVASRSRRRSTSPYGCSRCS